MSDTPSNPVAAASANKPPSSSQAVRLVTMADKEAVVGPLSEGVYNGHDYL